MEDKDGKTCRDNRSTEDEDSRTDLSSSKYSRAVSEVSSGEFKATFSKKSKEPKDFWNVARPSPESMLIHISLMKKELLDVEEGLPF
jgi:hypothetical protein